MSGDGEQDILAAVRAYGISVAELNAELPARLAAIRGALAAEGCWLVSMGRLTEAPGETAESVAALEVGLLRLASDDASPDAASPE